MPLSQGEIMSRMTKLASIESLCLIVFLGICFPFTTCQLTVDTPVGQIEGKYDMTNNSRQYLGIPFAKPPIGDLRFRKPQPLEDFTLTFMATTYGSPCAPNSNGDEDCLTLNIYVPINATMNSTKAVMVYIHGGAFQYDTASRYDGSGLAARGDVIVVTTNYRLGVFGFLNTEDDNSRGNFGLWDQNLALQWVRKNIKSFGGDPDRVTLVAESAGAAAAAYHALTTHSQQLFQTMILQSGTATAPFAFNRTPRKYALEFAQKAGCKTNDQVDMDSVMTCLRSKNASDLASASTSMNPDLGMAVVDFTWVPSIDGDFILDNPNTLISNHTYLSDIGFFDKDLILGMTNDEGALVFKLAQINGIQTIDSASGVSKTFFEGKFVPAIANQKFGRSSKETNQAMRYMYESITALEDRSFVTNVEWFSTYSDATFLSPITMHALAHSSGMGKGKTYVYLFDHSISYNTDPVVTGTPHGGDVPYVFGFVPFTGSPSLNYTAEEFSFSQDVIRFWSNMAKSGSPNEPDINVPVTWPKFNQTDQTFLKLSTQMSSASISMGLFSRRAEFWLDFMPAILPTEKNPVITPIIVRKTEVTEIVPAAAPKSDRSFIDRFSLDSAGAESAIIGLAVVVALLAALVLVIIVGVVMTNRRRKKEANFSTQ